MMCTSHTRFLFLCHCTVLLSFCTLRSSETMSLARSPLSCPTVVISCSFSWSSFWICSSTVATFAFVLAMVSCVVSMTLYNLTISDSHGGCGGGGCCCGFCSSFLTAAGTVGTVGCCCYCCCCFGSSFTCLASSCLKLGQQWQ